MSVLVTGGTGTLGRALVPLLDHPRVLSRHAGPGRYRGDLSTGDGLATALDGVDVVVHCASRSRPGDADDTRRLLDAARRTGSPHVVYISIVGADRIPLAYYREKVRVEQLIAGSGLPWTVLRATQFHDLVAGVSAALSRLGVVPVLDGTSCQPVSVDEVAARLAALAAGPPAGRVDDLGGPEVRSMADLARAWLAATGRRRPLVPLWLPGATARGFRAGRHLTPEHADGVETFEQYLTRVAS